MYTAGCTSPFLDRASWGFSDLRKPEILTPKCSLKPFRRDQIYFDSPELRVERFLSLSGLRFRRACSAMGQSPSLS